MQGKPLSSTNCKYFFQFEPSFLNAFKVGKTQNPLCISVLFSLMNEVVHTSPTIGSNVEEIVVKNTHFLMWDIGGQESLRSSWNTYYSNTEVRNTLQSLSHSTVAMYCRAQFSPWAQQLVFARSTDGSIGRPSQRSPYSQRSRSEKQRGQLPQ